MTGLDFVGVGVRAFCRDCVSPLSIFAFSSIVLGIAVAWIALASNPGGIAGGLATEAAGVLVGTGLIEAALAGVQRARTRQELTRSVEIHVANAHLAVPGSQVWCDLIVPNRYATVAYDVVLTFNVPVELSSVKRVSALPLENQSTVAISAPPIKLEANEFHHIGLLDAGQANFYHLTYAAEETFPQFVLSWKLPTPTHSHQKYNGFLPVGSELRRRRSVDG